MTILVHTGHKRVMGVNEPGYIIQLKSLTLSWLTVIRFHNSAEEKVIGRDVVTPICDDVQLTVDEYRTKLYEVRCLIGCNCYIFDIAL